MNRLVVALALVTLTALQPARAGEQRYTVHDLGSVEGGASFARAVGPNRKAAGLVYFDIDGLFRPALFELGKLPTPILTDGPGMANGVNASSEVVGWYRQGSAVRGFHWRNNVLTTLPTLGGDTVATGINSRSEIVGWSEASPGERRAIRYVKGQITDLGWGGVASQATAINDRGDIAGFRDVLVDGAIVREGVRVIKGQLRVLNAVVGAPHVVPVSINGEGDVAGYLPAADNLWEPSMGAFRFGAGMFALIGKTVTKVPASDPLNGHAGLSVNSAGQVVGYSFDGAADPRLRARLWQKGQTTPLDYLPEALSSGWRALGEATGINDDGVIVGTGQTALPNVSIRAYMLVPQGQGEQ